MSKSKHPPTNLWVEMSPYPHLRGDAGCVLANDYVHDEKCAFIVRAVNSHAAFVDLAERIVEQDEFTHSENAPQSVRQAYAILNTWRERAADALKLAKES